MPATQKDARALSGRRMWRVRLTKIKLQYQEKNVGGRLELENARNVAAA
jgi:hypothetical protein